MDNLTPVINQQNIEAVRREIAKKNSWRPYFASNSVIQEIVSDQDSQPYNRWYRGVYYYPGLIIAERDCGFRSVENQCYNTIIPPQYEPEPRSCFESACSTIYPCYPSDNGKYEPNDLVTNRSCLVQYR